MKQDQRKALEAAGFRVGDAGDFLGLSPIERQLVELRVSLAEAIRQRRELLDVSQATLAKAIGSSQSRVAKIEAGEAGISLDLMARGLFALGAEIVVKPKPGKTGSKPSQTAKKKVRKPTRRGASA